MFVSDTFLSSLDRLSVRSTLTGKTGSLLGVISSIGFILACVLIFIGPVIFYFKGDFIQGHFPSRNSEDLDLYSGCDFKLAISFYSKATGQVANHSSIKQFMTSKILYISPDQTQYYADVKACDDNYFKEYDKPHNFKSEDCFIAPDGLGYQSQILNNYASVFGFTFRPYCPDPFLCTYAQADRNLALSQMLSFFSNYYYVLRFTATYIDEKGDKKMKFYEIYSTQWQNKGVVTALSYALLQTQIMYMDNSIMPWYNNDTSIATTWFGMTSASTINQINAQTYGTAAMIGIMPYQQISYREYKKLDWLLGMLGGGFLLLFIIFWVPCNFISTLKQKYQNCASTTLVRNQNDYIHNINPPKFSFIWYLSNILPFNLKCFKTQNKIMQNAQKLLDITQIIKKLKVAKKNLKLAKLKVNFQPRNLQFQSHNLKTNYEEQQIKHQLDSQIISKIRQTTQIPQLYSHSLPMLTLYSNNQQNQSIKKQISNIISKQVYQKDVMPEFQDDQQAKSFCSRLCSGFVDKIGKFIKFFDAFGAKPVLKANPENYSVLGCLLILAIMILAIFTFALTLHNMGVVRSYWDQIFIDPQKQQVNMVTGDKFKAAICFKQQAFTYNLVTGQSRVVDIKFFQYTRTGSTQKYQYYNVDLMSRSSNPYFDVQGSYYNSSIFNFTYCFKPQNGNPIKYYGDKDTQDEAYFGFTLVPYCSGTTSYCQSQTATTNRNFIQFMNNFMISYFFPQAQYFPQYGKIIINPSQAVSNFAANSNTLNFTQSLEGIFMFNTLQIIDDWASWIMGEFPKPRQRIFTFESVDTQTRYKSVASQNPYFTMKLLPSGRVNRYVFTSYKIDFLFATIGGCFVFYYMFFGCFGKAFNNYKVKVKLAEVLYNETSTSSTGLKSFLKWLRIPCCKDQVLQKIQNDLDCTRIAKHVDNIYRLSAATNFSSPLQKNLSLIYLKQTVKSDDPILIQQINDNSSQTDNNDDQSDFQHQWQILKNKQSAKLNPHSKNAIINQSQADIKSIKEKQDLLQENQNYQNQPVQELAPTVRSEEKCGKFVNWFDLFHNNSQLTLNGERTVKSVCGGFCCIILLIFICVLTSHFLTVYFSDWHQVSSMRVGDQSDKRKMHFTVGKDFKLGLSFLKAETYRFFNVSSLVQNVGISLFKYKVLRITGQTAQTTVQTVDLQPCSPNYFDGFMNQYDRTQYFTELRNSYCVPDGTTLDLYGSVDDQSHQYFSLRIYNKFGYNNTAGINYVKNLLSQYLPQFYISSPLIDYRPQSPIRYQIFKSQRASYYTGATSYTYNITIAKNIIEFDTAVNPSNQRPTFQTYQVGPVPGDLTHSITDSRDLYFQINFASRDMYHHHIIKKIKVNQIFGIIGGCIAFLFFGLGFIPRSFNQFRMRYIIGSKLYIIMGLRNKKIKPKKVKGSKLRMQPSTVYAQYQYLTQCQLVYAWIISYCGFLKKQFDKSPLLKRYYLIESRISKDINIYDFMKNLYACQSAINKHLKQIQGINLCRVYPKQIVSAIDYSQNQANIQAKQNLINQVRRQKQLYYATRINKFNEWQLKILLEAKQQALQPSEYFTQRWLDQFLGSKRLQGSQTGFNSSSGFSQGADKSFKINREIKKQKQPSILKQQDQDKQSQSKNNDKYAIQ